MKKKLLVFSFDGLVGGDLLLFNFAQQIFRGADKLFFSAIGGEELFLIARRVSIILG